MGGLEVSYAGAFGAGVLSFLSPCVLPLVPAYLCFIGGVTLDEYREGRAGGRVFVAALAFVLGFATVFVALGTGASAVGRWLVLHMDLLAQVAGAVIVMLGLHFLGVLPIARLYRELRFHPAARPAGPAGAYVVGLAFAFGWTPCVGPVLAAILMVAGSAGAAGHGAALLGTYAAGMGVPFLLAALAARPFMEAMGRLRRHVRLVERALGLLLVATGLLFITGGMTDLAVGLLELVPALGRIG
ncbi:cytochrome c biogenesis CcdA family protein [Azospirillum halopraeferens]|uniref:cytochrome c biogenesis CcdA family protein n=1 Tax=Azospirillum halopraeferens TaxID=34010 RepID=UPI00048FBF45|nr:cytochrome c biogenesis protein CcdA [Azospirillum halopraeferens]